MRLIFYSLLLINTAVIFQSCTKESVTHNIHKDTVITGNRPPYYNGISSIVVTNYVNRMYIDLIGREPLEDELDLALDTLYANDLSVAGKEKAVIVLFSTDAYFNKFNSDQEGKFLNGADSSDFAERIYVFNFILMDTSLSDIEKQVFQYEITKLTNTINAMSDYQNGQISMSEYYARIINNNIYDDINMGSENFVKATFENLFNRLPTQDELQAGISMVDGQSSTLFLLQGSSKEDFVEIVTNYKEFFEGRVSDYYQLLLLRNPTSVELVDGTNLIINSGLQAFHQYIVKSKEYAGF